MQAARSVDIALVVRNWLFGWYIVEFENGGVERSELYGKELIKRLSEKLRSSLGKGFSKRSLEQYRKFYSVYKEITQALPAQSLDIVGVQDNIQQAAPAQSFELISKNGVLREVTAELLNHFVLGWTHYVTLLTVKNAEERRFYELEAVNNGWGYRELERQINSALYERLALSRDTAEVKRLSVDGQLVEKSSDVIKSPYILAAIDAKLLWRLLTLSFWNLTLSFWNLLTYKYLRWKNG